MSFSISTTFPGKYIREWVSDSVFGAESLEYFNPLLNVKSTAVIPRLQLGNSWQADSCDWSASGTVTLSEYTISVCDIKQNIEVCKTDLETTFESEFQRAGALNSDIPSTVQDFLAAQLAAENNEQVEFTAWRGDTKGATGTYLDQCDGLLKKMSADTSVVGLSSNTLSSSNIIAQLNRVYDAIPTIVRTKPDYVIFISPEAEGYYKQAVAAASAEAYYTKDAPMTFLGKKLVVAPGMPANKMVGARTGMNGNLWYATDLESDKNELRFIDMSENDGSDNVRIKSRFKLGFGLRNSSEIVFYGKS